MNSVKDLLSAGADIHAQNDLALRCSAENGHIEVLDGGADVLAAHNLALRTSVAKWPLRYRHAAHCTWR